MNTHELIIYVSSNEADDVPLSPRDVSERLCNGELTGKELAWHEGLTGWMPLKQIPTWSSIQAASQLAKKSTVKPKSKQIESKEDKMISKAVVRQHTSPREKSSDQKFSNLTSGSGAGSKILIGFAITTFLFTFCAVGLIISQNLDQLTAVDGDKPKNDKDKILTLPSGISCISCKEIVSTTISQCLQCGHPIEESIDLWKKQAEAKEMMGQLNEGLERMAEKNLSKHMGEIKAKKDEINKALELARELHAKNEIDKSRLFQLEGLLQITDLVEKELMHVVDQCDAGLDFKFWSNDYRNALDSWSEYLREEDKLNWKEKWLVPE